MITDNNKNLHLTIINSNITNDAVVNISLDSKLSGCTLNKLKGVCMCNSLPNGSEESCLFYAFFLVVQKALCGDLLAVSKSKVSSVSCGSSDDSFNISYHVKANGSAIRKSLGIVLKCMQPAKLFSIYSDCFKSVVPKGLDENCEKLEKIPVDKNHFNFVVNHMVKSIKSKINCVVIGKLKLDNINIKEMLNVLIKKVPVNSELKEASESKSHHINCNHENFTEVKVSGWESQVLTGYINSKKPGLVITNCGKNLLININKSQFDTLSAKLKQGVSDYISQKYGKFDEKILPSILCYVVANESIADSDNLISLVKKNTKVSDIVTSIKKLL